MRTIASTALVMVLTMGTQAWAQCSHSKATKSTKATCQKSDTKLASSKSCSKSACGDKAGCCPKSCAPKMTHLVAGERICCPKNAEILAKANDSTIQFAVGNETFENKGEAMQALATALERYLGEMTTVRYAVGDDCVGCPTAAKQLASKNKGHVKYRVASFDFECDKKAAKIAKTAREAADKVHMKMVVGDKEYSCKKATAAACQKSGKKCTYKVGEKSTCCETTAKVQLAQARIDAAVSAIQKQMGA